MTGIALDQAYPGLLASGEAQLLTSLMGPPRAVEMRQRITRRNQPQNDVLYLSEGFVGRYREDRLSRRQILAIQVPGDFFDLPSYALGRLDHDVEALCQGAVRAIPHATIGQLREAAPALYHKLWHISQLDAAIHRYWVFRVGRLVGRARLANFFSEIFTRLYARGLCGPDGFKLPINQSELGEVCGMTAVHINRMVGELRAEGICSFRGAEVRIDDLSGLFATGQFDWDYLFVQDELDAELSALTGKRPRVAVPKDDQYGGKRTVI